MDTLTSIEFHKIFRRASTRLNLKGKFTVAAIEAELRRAVKRCKEQAATAETQSQRTKCKKAALNYQNLIDYGFAERTILEANANPSGIIALTLKYGADEAKRKILAQKRAEIRRRYRR